MCDEPMKEHGRDFLCEPCKQIIIFLVVSETYVVSLGAAVQLFSSCHALLGSEHPY
jgi:hypothetical protein